MKKMMFLIGLSFLITGCVKQYKGTVKLHERNLYIETFNVNPAGVDCHYVTDSVTFRLYIGKFDNEHENYHYWCRDDSLLVQKIGCNAFTGNMQVLDSPRSFSLSELKQQKTFD